MANTPGSPPETIAAHPPAAAWRSAAFGARAFLAIVGRMPRLAWPDRNAIEIRPVAVERIGGVERVAGLAREIALIPRAEPDDREAPAHGRPSQPGTSTMAK